MEQCNCKNFKVSLDNKYWEDWTEKNMKRAVSEYFEEQHNDDPYCFDEVDAPFKVYAKCKCSEKVRVFEVDVIRTLDFLAEEVPDV